MFPQLRKTYCVIIILIFLHKWEKRVTERNKRLSLWILFINWGTQAVYVFCWLNHWTWLMPDPMRGSWILWFFSNGEGWDCFWLAKVLSRLSKITYLLKVSKNERVGSILICSKSTKWEIWESIVSSVMEKQEVLNLNSGVSVIQRVLFCTPPQKELTSLLHIHVTLKNLFIFSLRGYCYQIWAVKQLLDRSP